MSRDGESASGKQCSVYPALLGFVAGIVTASAIGLAAWGLVRPARIVSTITGNLEVEYMFETSPTEANGSKIPASRVEFHPHYVVVTDSSGRTRLWATDRLRNFTVTSVADRE